MEDFRRFLIPAAVDELEEGVDVNASSIVRAGLVQVICLQGTAFLKVPPPITICVRAEFRYVDAWLSAATVPGTRVTDCCTRYSVRRVQPIVHISDKGQTIKPLDYRFEVQAIGIGEQMTRVTLMSPKPVFSSNEALDSGMAIEKDFDRRSAEDASADTDEFHGVIEGAAAAELQLAEEKPETAEWMRWRIRRRLIRMAMKKLAAQLRKEFKAAEEAKAEEPKKARTEEPKKGPPPDKFVPPPTAKGKKYYPKYNRHTAKQIGDAFPKAWKIANGDGGTYEGITVKLIAKEVPLDYGTVSRYISAFRKMGIRQIHGIDVPPGTQADTGA